MEYKNISQNRSLMIGILLLAVIIIAVFSFSDRSPDYYHALHIRFEDDTSAEQELLILEQYTNAIILDADDPILHDYTLVFPELSERKVRDLVSSLCNTEGVYDASYLRVIHLPEIPE